jgi:hypothetical protein
MVPCIRVGVRTAPPCPAVQESTVTSRVRAVGRAVPLQLTLPSAENETLIVVPSNVAGWDPQGDQEAAHEAGAGQVSVRTKGVVVQEVKVHVFTWRVKV